MSKKTSHLVDAFMHSLGPDIRYYRGIIKCELMEKFGRKARIRYMESGEVGPKGLKKMVRPGYYDITLIRFCWRKRK